jgi:hypothetical protein
LKTCKPIVNQIVNRLCCAVEQTIVFCRLLPRPPALLTVLDAQRIAPAMIAVVRTSCEFTLKLTSSRNSTG